MMEPLMIRLIVQGERDELQEVVNHLKKQPEDITSLSISHEEMTAELEKALEEENRLRAELEAERSSRTEIQKQKEDLEKELASLQQQKTELESQMQLVDGELKKAQEELEEKTASLSSTTLNQTQQELTIQTLNVGL